MVYLANNISYTPFGALKTLQNGCYGTGQNAGCTLMRETYDYNNRLQPVRIQLGTSSSNAANYCLVYNYYTVASNPTTCVVPAAPPSGAQNNGNLMGYLYQDTTNPSLGNTVTYTYDSLNRLTSAKAIGSSSYNLSYVYNQDGSGQYGNMTCQGGLSTVGYCDTLAFNSANNHITTTGFSYDAAGNVTADNNGNTFAWDAEGRTTTVNGTPYMFNAWGWPVEQLPTGYKVELLYEPHGAELGNYDGVNNAWSSEYIHLGQRVVANYMPSNLIFIHADHLGTTTMVTNQVGSVVQDQLFYPWGSQWNYPNAQYDLHFAGLRNGGDLKSSLTRTDNTRIGRWLSPDPGGKNVVRLDDPQTWNMYAYVRNNPTTFTDPTGLDLWLSGCGKETETCHKNYVGTYNDKGKFIPTTIQSDENGNFKGHTVTFDTSGIHIDSKYQGVFASGTDATVVNGSGVMTGFQLTANTNSFGTTTAGGDLRALPGHSLGELGSLLTHIQGEDLITGHPGTQLRGGTDSGPDIHVSFEGGAVRVSAHFDWRYPGTWDGLRQHYRDYRAYKERSKTMTRDPDYDLVGPQPED